MTTNDHVAHDQHDDHDHGGHDHDEDGHGHDERDHGHGHGERDHGHGRIAGLRHLFGGHTHDVADQVDSELEASHEGTRALWISLVVLGITTVIQGGVVLVSHSVALLGDTLHNFGDALTAVPLGLAFVIGRRAANDRYTYGYGRGEDLAGLAVVLVVVISALVAGYEAINRLLHPADVHALGWVAAAAVVGFIGNEIAARVRITTGKRIGSAALVADGVHARTDGLTSLAVLVGAGGVALGWRWADPVVGLLITIAIVSVVRSAVRSVWHRLMDAVDPELVANARAAGAAVPGVIAVEHLRVRWIGHRLHAETEILVPGDLDVVAAHQLAHDVEHQIIHAVPRLTEVLVHASPEPVGIPDAHRTVAHHRRS